MRQLDQRNHQNCHFPFFRLSLAFSRIDVPFSPIDVPLSVSSTDGILGLFGGIFAGIEDGGASERTLALGLGATSESSMGSRILTRLSGGEVSILTGSCGDDGGRSGEESGGDCCRGAME